MLYRKPFLQSDGVLVTVYTRYKINQQPLQIILRKQKDTCHVSLSLLVMHIPEMEFMKVKDSFEVSKHNLEISQT